MKAGEPLLKNGKKLSNQKKQAAHDPIQDSWMPWVYWSCGALFYCYQFILRTCLNTIGHDLMHDLHLTATVFSSIISLGYLAYTLMQIPAGVFLDALGARRLLTLATVICASGTLLFATSDQAFFLQIGRILYGIGASCAFIGCAKLASMWFPPHKMPVVLGMTVFLGALGGSAAGAGVAVIVEHIGWRAMLYGMSIIGFVLSAIIFIVVRDRIVPQSSSKSSAKNKSVGLLAGLKQAIHTPQIVLAALFVSCMYLPLSIFGDAWGNTFLMKVYGLSHVDAASANSALYLGFCLGSPLFGWLATQYQNIPVILKSCCAILIALIYPLLWMPQIVTGHVTIFTFLIGFVIAGQTLIFTLAVANGTHAISGSVAGFVNMLSMISGALFQYLIGVYLDWTWAGTIVDDVREYDIHHMQIAVSCILVGMMIALTLGLFLKNKITDSVEEHMP